jgi:hypothetical protein
MLTLHSATRQAALVAENIEHILQNDEPLEEYEITDPPAIHMSLGVVSLSHSVLLVQSLWLSSTSLWWNVTVAYMASARRVGGACYQDLFRRHSPRLPMTKH